MRTPNAPLEHPIEARSVLGRRPYRERSWRVAIALFFLAIGPAEILGSDATAAAPAGAAASSPEPLELVLTIPSETTLSRQGLRSPSEVWPELFDRATQSIDLGEMYVSRQPGSALDRAIDHLARAGARGVRIRFLIEKKMSAVYPQDLDSLRRIPNLELRIIEHGLMGKGGILHAKYMVIDGKRAYVGSQNFDWRSLEHIHELGVAIADPKIAHDVQAIFDHDWNAARLIEEKKPVPPMNQSRPRARSEDRAYLVASPYEHNPPGIGDSESELVRLIGDAKNDVWIQLLDYCPLAFDRKSFYPPIDNALRSAAARGVKVRLMVSDWNTELPCLQHVKSLALIPNVAAKIVTIPQAKSGFIPFARVVHSKYMVIDRETLWVGTSNWIGGYLDSSRNLEIVARDPALAAKAASLHQELWDSSYAQPVDVMKEYPRPKKK